MVNPETSLSVEERLSARLRALYESWGYRPWKASRFEEYELYMRNKRFLTDERILTFTDTDGKLMALRPDVTLSVVKNAREEDLPLRICYTESVFRAPRNGDGFREIMQTGIEVIGFSSSWSCCEALLLAAKSLCIIRPNGWQLDVSDMGIIADILEGEMLAANVRTRILAAIRGKSLHGLKETCEDNGVSDKTTELLSALVEISGRFPEALAALTALPLPEPSQKKILALREIGEAADALNLSHICLDFSVVNDMSYYNGLIFSGFVQGVPTPVLSGGRYDPLLSRLGKRGHAVGFAVYLDQAVRSEKGSRKVQETIYIPTKGRRAPEIARDMEAIAATGKRAAAEEAET